MSEYVHTERRPAAEGRTIESRLMFGAFYALFLLRAVAKRLMPWRRHAAFGRSIRHESIFTEASVAASVMVVSSFMGL